MRVMMDLGAHKGADSAFYLRDRYKVIAVEAHPGLARECEATLSLLNSTTIMPGEDIIRYRVLKAAVTPTGEEAHLYCSNKGLQGETHSIYPHRVKGCEDVGYTVAGTTIPRLFKNHGVPYYLKVDIEGADVVAIRQLHDCKAVPPYLSVEPDRDHPEEALEIMAHFGYMGYDSFDLVRQHWDKTVDIETLSYNLTLNQLATLWFSMPPFDKDEWYDVHAKHQDVQA